MELTDYTRLTDRQLIEKALKHDPGAFGQLFTRYKKELLQLYIQRTGRHEPDAKDILQETFIKVYLHLERYNPDYPFSQWLHAIARNTFIDFTRKRRENLLSIDGPNGGAACLNPPADTANPEEKLMQRQAGKELDRILDSLPPRYKQMIVMRFIQQYSYEEIAEKLDMPLGTVKTQIHRARERFYQLIGRSDGIL